jgi:hypothetical protein
MATDKRRADGYGSGPLVKRQKSDANLNGAITLAHGRGQNGALVQAVSGLRNSYLLLILTPTRCLERAVYNLLSWN